MASGWLWVLHGCSAIASFISVLLFEAIRVSLWHQLRYVNMKLFKRNTKLLFITSGPLVALGLFLLIKAGAPIPRPIPYCIAAIGVAGALLGGHRRFLIEGDSFVIHEFKRKTIVCRVTIKVGKACANKVGMGSKDWDMQEDKGFCS
jgi:hypothetical protein